MYSYVFVSYNWLEILMCTMMCMCELPGLGYVTEYSNVCLSYRVREILLFNLMRF